MKHPNAMMDRVGGGINGDGFPIQNNLTAGIRLNKAGKNLHQGAFTCTVFPQNSLNGTGWYREIDILIGVYFAKMLVDVFEFYVHGRFGTP